jgi:Tfp pilus assembly protein PilZ
LFASPFYEEEDCPILDISRGGLSFLAQKNFRVNRRLTMKISIPEENEPLNMRGRIRWTAPNPGFSYRFQVGVQFDAYGLKKGLNNPVNLTKLEALELTYAKEDKE